MSAAMSQDEQSTEKTLAGTMESPDVTPQKGSFQLLVKKRESASATRPSLVRQRPPAPRSRARKKRVRVRSVEILRAEGRIMETIEEEPLGSPGEIETFPIAVEELQSHFESLGGRKGAESEMRSLSPARTSKPESNPGVAESGVKRRRAVFEMLSENGQNSNAKVSGGGRKPLRGLREARPPKSGSMLQVFEENVSLKDKVALYQAAASKAENRNCFANNISQEIKACNAPGGLAAGRRHFENRQTASSRMTVARSQHEQKTAQVAHKEKVTPETSGDKACAAVQHADETAVSGTMNGEIPKVSTQICNNENALHHDMEAATSAQRGKFLRYTESVHWRSDKKCQKVEGGMDQPFIAAQKMEVLGQPKSTMPSAASRMKALKAIIKTQQHAIRCPRHLGAGAPNPEWERNESSVIQVFPNLKEPQRREPLRQPIKKINFAASRLKIINEIHKTQRIIRRCPNQQEAALVAYDTQWSETTECVGKDKEEALAGDVLCSNAQHVSNKNL